MKLLAFRNFFMVVGLAFLVLMGASYDARAQGRDRNASKWDKKCDKFVNCHDASEGRLDGRGPRRGSDSNNWDSRRFRRDRDFDRFGNHQNRWRHQRDRDFDRDGNWRRHRNYGDRDFDRNGQWRHRNRDRNGTWSRRG
jgi:hypothetical protein